MPVLVVIGGFAGSGKTTISRRLAQDLGWPRLEADLLGKTVRSLDFVGTNDEAYRAGYAVLWRLCGEFLADGVSVIVDANMAWEVAWQSVDALLARSQDGAIVPLILRCPREVCLRRIRRRYRVEPGKHGDPERFNDAHATMLWRYLSQLQRDDVIAIDANRPTEDVYADVMAHVTARFDRDGLA